MHRPHSAFRRKRSSCFFSRHVSFVRSSWNSHGSTVSGSVQDRQGNPVSAALVRLRSEDYVNSDNTQPIAGYANTVTDSNGTYVVLGIGSGSYVVEVNDGESTAVRVRCDVVRDDDTVDIGVRTLEPYASVRGTIVSGSGAGATAVVIQGLDSRVSVNAATGGYALTDLPAGSYTVQVIAQSPDYGTVQIATESLAPSGTADLPSLTLPQFDTENYATWPGSTRIKINTSASGAGIPENVAGFPLLVRLDRSTPGFTFSTSGSVPNNVWTHLAAKFDASAGVGELFVNGTSQGTFTDTLPVEYYTDRPFPLYFGGPPSLPQRIVGTLDEIRIEAAPRSAAWVKLSYENQRRGGNVIVVQ
ncbi:MAG: hypothetical protein GF398_17200 [Chitinivibrionales bacterium]|nr:hypothetical protein [Chitinivibrionales bacterium]